MKKDSIIFILASLVLGGALIFGLNKMRTNGPKLEENSNVSQLNDLQSASSQKLEDSVENKNQEEERTMPATLSANQALSKPAMTIDQDKTYLVTLNTTQGPIVIQLDSQNTPVTSNNFVYLVEKGFYNKTIFHRTIEGFMIQGGDPRGDGTGSPGYRFDDEDFVGEYTRGTVAMANSGPNTNGSQFFIMHQDSPLPKNYVIFGQVVEGIEVVDAIATAPVGMSLSGEKSRPINPIMIESASVTTN